MLYVSLNDDEIFRGTYIPLDLLGIMRRLVHIFLKSLRSGYASKDVRTCIKYVVYVNTVILYRLPDPATSSTSRYNKILAFLMSHRCTYTTFASISLYLTVPINSIFITSSHQMRWRHPVLKSLKITLFNPWSSRRYMIPYITHHAYI